MKKIAINTLVMAIATFASNIPTTGVAQLFYPPASDRRTVMVLGQGQASVPADVARIRFLITSEDGEGEFSPPPNRPTIPFPPLPTLPPVLRTSSELELAKQLPPSVRSQIPTAPRPVPSPRSPQPRTEELTRDSLKPIVDALIASGVAADGIEVNVGSAATSSQWGEGTAEVLVKLEKPTRDRVSQVVSVARDATSDDNLLVQYVTVEYALNDCQVLENAVYQAAFNNAKSRAQALATAMGVKLGIPSISEPFFGLLYPVCDVRTGTIAFPFGSTPSPYDPTAPTELQLKRDLFFTFSIR